MLCAWSVWKQQIFGRGTSTPNWFSKDTNAQRTAYTCISAPNSRNKWKLTHDFHFSMPNHLLVLTWILCMFISVEQSVLKSSILHQELPYCVICLKMKTVCFFYCGSINQSNRPYTPCSDLLTITLSIFFSCFLFPLLYYLSSTLPCSCLSHYLKVFLSTSFYLSPVLVFHSAAAHLKTLATLFF